MKVRLCSLLGIATLLVGVACEAGGREGPAVPRAESPKEVGAHAPKEKAPEPAGDVPAGARFKVNSAKSRVIAQVGVGGMLKGLGHPHLVAIREVQGDAETAAHLAGAATIRLRFITASAAETSKEFDEKNRQKVDAAVRQEALETARFPEAVFKSRKVEVKESGEHTYAASISGDLTLHGVTHEVSFPAKVTVQGKSLRAEGSFTILHSSYGIKRLSAVGGTIKAKDEILLSFDILADPD